MVVMILLFLLGCSHGAGKALGVRIDTSNVYASVVWDPK